MNSTARRIFVACAVGSMAGLVAASVVPYLLWWIGALVGGVVSGCIFALPEIVSSASIAARNAWNTLSYLPKAARTMSRMVAASKRAGPLARWETAALIMWFILIAVLLAGSIMLPKPWWHGFFWPMLAYVGAIEVLLFGGSLVNSNAPMEKRVRQAKLALMLSSPLAPLAWVYVGVPIGRIWIPRIAKAAFCAFGELLLFTVRFLRNLFVFIHSRELILCTIDGALGVVMSYPIFVVGFNLSLGPMLLCGGVIGGLLGVLNYEIVSKRILHCAPHSN